MSGPFKMRGTPFQRNFKLNVGEGQGSKRKGKHTLDLDEPGGRYHPNYEPTEGEDDHLNTGFKFPHKK